MSQYFIKAIILDQCSYSINAMRLLKEHNIPNEIIMVTYDNKDNYVSDKIDTFPQIYMKKYNMKGDLLLGGFDDLNYFISIFKGTKLTDENLNNFLNKYKWSRKATLRLIQLINHI
jgi:hypothetical protein